MDNPVLKIELTTGTILVDCFPADAPNHVKQILELAAAGEYDDTPFHRVIDNFMAQGGSTGKQHPNLVAEFNGRHHGVGACSMARTNDPNSASDQFFICFSNCNWLDRQYTVWGQVIYGMNNVHALNKGEPPADPSKIISMRQVDLSSFGA